MDVQYVNIKIYSTTASPPTLERFIPIFHSWIQDDLCEELLVDVVDYGHVPAGPGVMLIAHEANFSVEYGAENRFGLLYSTKGKREGSNQQKIEHAVQQCLKAAMRLQEDDHLKGELKFSGADFRLFVNRRLQVSNDESSFNALKPEIEMVFDNLLGGSDFSLVRISTDSRERLTVEIKNNAPVALTTLLQQAETS